MYFGGLYCCSVIGLGGRALDFALVMELVADDGFVQLTLARDLLENRIVDDVFGVARSPHLILLFEDRDIQVVQFALGPLIIGLGHDDHD